jgi:hypothetical protein
MKVRVQNMMALAALVFLIGCLCTSLVVLTGAQRGSVSESAIAGTVHQINDSTNTEQQFSDAEYAQHIQELKKKLPGDDFHIVLQRPFVVIGDGPLESVEHIAKATVAWAVDMIKQDYFERDPLHIIDVWLFKDKESYVKHCQLLFGSKPHTPFGYYSSTNRALVMNISTGGGTLVHEIVHPFIEANFASCPAWFNEGLASLYEQSRSQGGHIMGSTNWRLRGLQLAIQDERLPSFEELCSTTTREFYDGASTNYAQARYLCYFLQEQNQLVRFYHEFVKDVEADPTGFQTLQGVLNRSDMAQFQKEWEAYVMKLRFR